VEGKSTLFCESDLIRAIRQCTPKGVLRAADSVISSNFRLRPTITIGRIPVRLIAHFDFILAPWHGQESLWQS
jgi:hypothetical protein